MLQGRCSSAGSEEAYFLAHGVPVLHDTTEVAGCPKGRVCQIAACRCAMQPLQPHQVRLLHPAAYHHIAEPWQITRWEKSPWLIPIGDTMALCRVACCMHTLVPRTSKNKLMLLCCFVLVCCFEETLIGARCVCCMCLKVLVP